MRVVAVFQLICIFYARADVRPYTLEDRVKTLESQAIIPLMNRQAIQRIDEGILERWKSDEIPQIANDNVDSTIVLARIDKLEAKVNGIVERFDSLTKGLSDEKILRKITINAIRNDIDIFKKSLDEGLEDKLKEEIHACQTVTKEQQKLLIEQLKSELQEVMQELRNSVDRRQDRFEDECDSREQRISSMYDDKLNTFQEHIKSELNARHESCKDNQEALANLDNKLREHISASLKSDDIQQHNNAKPGVNGKAVQCCPEPWKLHGDMCYLVGSEQLSRSSASQKCRDYGAALANINDSGAKGFIINLGGANTSFWLGGKFSHYGCLVLVGGNPIRVRCSFRQRYICEKNIGIC